MKDTKGFKIKIVENGPYLVSGGVPITEKIIHETSHGNEYKNGQSYKQAEKYSLCRCGNSKNMPFCDGTHAKIGFDGKETASKGEYLDGAKIFEGPDLILTDKGGLCAFARFCHAAEGDVWTLTMNSDDPKLRTAAIKAACDCPAGRLVAWDRETEEAIEPEYEPSIVIIQDPKRRCSGPVWVRGGIPIESADGMTYELRNRVTLCRCGGSKNMPFCDATHVAIRFSDKK